MMHIFINGMGASAGGGLTYLRNVLPHLANREDVRATVVVSSESRIEGSARVDVVRMSSRGGTARRFWFEQSEIPKMIRACGASVLISAGNFAVRKSPVPQILLSRNSLYTSADFSSDLISRREFRMWLDTRIKAVFAKRSISWAERTVAPSQAFAGELRRWTGKPVTAIHHGFDRERFLQGQSPLPENLRAKLSSQPGVLRIALVSHYNYYRNFETVLRAVALMKLRTDAPPVRLFLTCELKKDKTPGAYDPASAAKLIEELKIRDQVVELDSVPYEQLLHVYKSCDLFVSAAYTETFAHPLVEAMASGVPVLVSDLAVHREICGEAAHYFSAFVPEQLAAQLSQLAADQPVRQSMAVRGREQSLRYSWRNHVAQVISLAEQLVETRSSELVRSAVTAA
jgi:glycosyltransferase involved in cell wall biosynthesis